MIARHSALVSTLAPVIAWVSDKATGVLLVCSVVGKHILLYRSGGNTSIGICYICGMEVPCDKPLEFGPFGAVAV